MSAEGAAHRLERRSLDRVAAGAAALLEVPIVLISLFDGTRQVVLGSHGRGPHMGSGDDQPSPLCREVATTRRPILLQDARRRLPATVRDGSAFQFIGYAGMPISVREDTHLGTFAAFSSVRRSWQSRDLLVLRGYAEAAGAIIDMRMGCEDAARESLKSHAAGVAVEKAERERASHDDRRHTLELEQTSVHDELTGLLNRRGFFTVGKAQLELVRRHAVPGMLLYIDLDGLKKVNDDFGHAAGDDLLRAAAAVLRRSFRDGDTIARLGGDELVVIATDTRHSAPAILARLAGELASCNRRRESTLPVKWSLGQVSIGPTDQGGLDALLAEADRRMYAVKRGAQGAGDGTRLSD